MRAARASPVSEEEDGTFSFAAPKRVVRELDEDVYAGLSDSLEKANQTIRGEALGARGINKILWGLIKKVLRRLGKALPWYQVACVTAVVICNHDKYPGDPPERRWVAAAARNIISSCL